MITCQICQTTCNFIELHLTQAHEEISLEEYKGRYPDAPLMSAAAAEKLAARAQDLKDNNKVRHTLMEKFGFELNASVTEAEGWEKPFENTPKIDPDYAFRKDNVAVVLFALESKELEPTLMVGPTGSGKSSVIEQVLARLNRPHYRMNFDEGITRSEFVGKDVLKSDETKFQEGILVKAVKEGAALIMDEFDAAPPSVTMLMQSVLEGGNLTLLEEGVVIEPHPDFKIFATANTNGMGDESGLYNGTQPQNFATLNRFTQIEKVDYPCAADEDRIILKKTKIADRQVRQNLIKVAKLVRDAHKKDEITGTMSTRAVINTGKKLLAYGDVKRAYELTVLNGLNSEDREVYEELIQRVWG
jgi:cobaltochelatase CobS